MSETLSISVSMSSSSKKVAFRQPLKGAAFESTGADNRDDGRHNAKGKVSSQYSCYISLDFISMAKQTSLSRRLGIGDIAA